jgi:hypothetical protein
MTAPIFVAGALAKHVVVQCARCKPASARAPFTATRMDARARRMMVRKAA